MTLLTGDLVLVIVGLMLIAQARRLTGVYIWLVHSDSEWFAKWRSSIVWGWRAIGMIWVLIGIVRMSGTR